MKLRVLISLLFVIATTFAVVHETEHIMHDHGSMECEVCLVSQNMLSDDVNSDFSELELFLSDKTVFAVSGTYRYQAIISNYSNAPPQLS
ncbi:MAG: hypothetical protein U9Q40_11610 [Campylobacterota bacterium]|nr:hypothetical protein [Campylobacterota bacterium]